MPRTTISVDDGLLNEARAALGTTGVSDTVTAALSKAVERARLAEFDIALFDITEDELRAARSDRLADHRQVDSPPPGT